MSQRSHLTGRAAWLLGIVVAAAGAIVLVVWLNGPADSPDTGPTPPASFPIPAYSETRFLNAGKEARYIGIDACAECHKGNHASYMLTAHSKALSDLDPKVEPPDATFEHSASRRSYRVYRQGSQFRHEEVVRKADGREIAKMDLPIKYLIGSGNFCRSYLVEVDGFLHESPLTWYTGRKKWDMSPGYDFPSHWSFERPIKVACLNCHVGRVEPAGGTVHKMTIHEQAIGCERCHGPGSLHAELHRGKKHLAGEEDLTIVNPGRLSRPLLEAVCAECHLN
jgi:hypothetical protein